MIRSLRVLNKNISCIVHLQKANFLTNDYKCTEPWISHRSASPILKKVNLNDLYVQMDQNYMSKGVISAADVDIFANAIKDSNYLDELRDLLHKLRMSAETGSTLESTHYATIRNYIEFGNIDDIIQILNEPLLFGVFLDHYTANMLLDKLISAGDFDHAATVASLVMKQEDYSNKITCALCQYATYKFILGYKPPPVVEVKEEKPKKKKVEEIKIRVKYLRNPYFDDHFDLKDPLLLAGKTLAWISEQGVNNLSHNLQLIGWLHFKKYDTLSKLCNTLKSKDSFKVYSEVIELMKKQIEGIELEDDKSKLEECLATLNNAPPTDSKLEVSLSTNIENAINQCQKEDVAKQAELFQNWSKIREEKLNEQLKRLDRAKRLELIEEKQKVMKEEEQKLWFFENEEQIDLTLEEKARTTEEIVETKVGSKDNDENYVPPEILPKKR